MVKKLTPANVAKWLEQEAAYDTTTGERLSKPIRALIAENEAKDAELAKLREHLTALVVACEHRPLTNDKMTINWASDQLNPSVVRARQALTGKDEQ